MSSPRAVVLVEGESDRIALLVLAGRRGRDLVAEGVEVLAMGGITNVRGFAERFGPHGLGLPLSGLYDAPEERQLRHGLARAGIDVGPTAADLAAAGFCCCTADLEDELVRALGVSRALEVVDRAGETPSFRLLAQMPAQRGWSDHLLVRRFLTSQSGRKARYARLFTEALDLERVPTPLDAVLDAAGHPG